MAACAYLSLLLHITRNRRMQFYCSFLVGLDLITTQESSVCNCNTLNTNGCSSQLRWDTKAVESLYSPKNAKKKCTAVIFCNLLDVNTVSI